MSNFSGDDIKLILTASNVYGSDFVQLDSCKLSKVQVLND